MPAHDPRGHPRRRRGRGHVLARKALAASLNARLSDGLDLHSQIKVAHWNIRGPHFASLHPLFETFAVSLANHNDAIAERAVTLGAKAYGAARHVAKSSGLPEYDQEAIRDLGEKEDDQDTVDLLTGVIAEFEKHVWFLRASQEG